MHIVCPRMCPGQHVKTLQYFLSASRSERLHDNADVPHITLRCMRASHPLRLISLKIKGIGIRQDKSAGVTVERVFPPAVSQIGHGQETWRIGIIHQIVISESIRFIGVYPSEFRMLCYPIFPDALLNLLCQRLTLCRQLFGFVIFPGYFRRKAHRLCGHHIGRNQITVITAIIRGPEA